MRIHIINKNLLAKALKERNMANMANFIQNNLQISSQPDIIAMLYWDTVSSSIIQFQLF